MLPEQAEAFDVSWFRLHNELAYPFISAQGQELCDSLAKFYVSFLQVLCKTGGSQVTSRVECLQVSTEKEIEVQDMLARLVDALLFSLFQTQMFVQFHEIDFYCHPISESVRPECRMPIS